MTANPILDLSDVRFTWPGKQGFSISIPDLSVQTGESLLLLGESGSGKSTLLSLLCGTLLPDAGAVTVNGANLTTLSARARDRFRAETIGVVFQQFNLLPFASVRDNILLPLRFAPQRRAKCAGPAQEASTLLTQLGLPEGLDAVKASTLSVGQQQRVAVARAMIGAPPIMIADEPTSALDETSQASFLDLMFGQVRAQNTTLLMVSHDPRLASRFDRVVNMTDIALIKRRAA